MAFASGRIWSVAWGGERADAARQILLELKGAPALCGGAGAAWYIGDWSELREGRVGATLIPADPHEIGPAAVLRELPIPTEAS